MKCGPVTNYWLVTGTNPSDRELEFAFLLLAKPGSGQLLVLYRTIMYCTVLYCTVWTVLCCTVLYGLYCVVKNITIILIINGGPTKGHFQAIILFFFGHCPNRPDTPTPLL